MKRGFLILEKHILEILILEKHIPRDHHRHLVSLHHVQGQVIRRLGIHHQGIREIRTEEIRGIRTEEILEIPIHRGLVVHRQGEVVR